MARKALIDSVGTVINVIEYDPDGGYRPPEGLSLLDDDGAQIGGTWDGTAFTPAPASGPVPAGPPSREEFDALTSAVETLTLAALGG